MNRWIVDEGTVRPFDRNNLPPRDSYARDWIVVDAEDEDDAFAQAWHFDHESHPATTEMELFAAAYRAYALDFEEEHHRP
jgi:hypothetical protein